MAEALLKLQIKDSNISSADWIVASAGCWAYPNMPATGSAAAAVSELGADLLDHAAQAVSAHLLEDFNLILCMENAHVAFINRHFPDHASKVFLLSEMIDQDFEIEDPIGRSTHDYQETAREIFGIIKKGWNKIQSLS